MPTIVDLEAAIACRDDFVFSTTDEAFSQRTLSSLSEWLDTTRQYLPRMCFPVYASNLSHEGKRLLYAHMDATDDKGGSAMLSIGEFWRCDRALLPMMSLPARKWKETMLNDLYTLVYGHPQCGIRNRILCASYLLDRWGEHSENPDLRMIPETLLSFLDETPLDSSTFQAQWDVYDLLDRHRSILTAPQRISLNVWSRTHRHDQPQRSDTAPSAVAMDGTTVIAAPDAYPMIDPKPRLPVTVGDDPQNAHTPSLTTSVREGLDVISTFPSSGRDILFWEKYITGQTPEAHPALLRIRADPTVFRSASDRSAMRLVEILDKVCGYIDQREDPNQRSELWRRLGEELCEAGATCSTGHLVRIVNALVGFHPDIHVGIDRHERRKMLLLRLIQMILVSGEDGGRRCTVDDLIDPPPHGIFHDFLQRHRRVLRSNPSWSSGEDTPHQLDRALWELFPTLDGIALLELPWEKIWRTLGGCLR